MRFMAVTALVASAWGLATAFGLLSYREWARLSVIVFAWLCIVFCLLPMLYFPWVPLAHIEGTSPNFNLYVRLFASGFFGFFVAVGCWWLYFFSKQSVKDQFAGKVDTLVAPSDGVHSKRPPSVTIVAWYLFITAFLFTATFSYRTPMSLFGYEISGWEAHLLKLVYALVHVLAMVGMLELRRWGRMLAICYFSFLILDTLASLWVPGGHPFFERLIGMAPFSVRLKGFFIGHSLIVAIGIALPLFVLPLWIVVTQKQAFLETA
jgi:hypothetical protein